MWNVFTNLNLNELKKEMPTVKISVFILTCRKIMPILNIAKDLLTQNFASKSAKCLLECQVTAVAGLQFNNEILLCFIFIRVMKIKKGKKLKMCIKSAFCLQTKDKVFVGLGLCQCLTNKQTWIITASFLHML